MALPMASNTNTSTIQLGILYRFHCRLLFPQDDLTLDTSLFRDIHSEAVLDSDCVRVTQVFLLNIIAIHRRRMLLREECGEPVKRPLKRWSYPPVGKKSI